MLIQIDDAPEGFVVSSTLGRAGVAPNSLNKEPLRSSPPTCHYIGGYLEVFLLEQAFRWRLPNSRARRPSASVLLLASSQDVPAKSSLIEALQEVLIRTHKLNR